jgi:hypothetical protein
MLALALATVLIAAPQTKIILHCNGHTTEGYPTDRTVELSSRGAIVDASFYDLSVGDTSYLMEGPSVLKMAGVVPTEIEINRITGAYQIYSMPWTDDRKRTEAGKCAKASPLF